MSELKFKLTTETKINAWGIKLFRIEATVDFKNGSTQIKSGDKGGWVESEKTSNGDARVSGNAWVYGDAEVYGDARVYGNARVSGDAQVYGNARVYGDARVSLKKAYTKGNFVYSSDSDIVSTVINQSGEDRFDSGRDYKNHLVVGDYEINDIEPENATENTEDTKTEGLVTIQIGENGFSVPESTAQSFRDALSSALGYDA